MIMYLGKVVLFTQMSQKTGSDVDFLGKKHEMSKQEVTAENALLKSCGLSSGR